MSGEQKLMNARSKSVQAHSARFIPILDHDQRLPTFHASQLIEKKYAIRIGRQLALAGIRVYLAETSEAVRRGVCSRPNPVSTNIKDVPFCHLLRLIQRSKA